MTAQPTPQPPGARVGESGPPWPTRRVGGGWWDARRGTGGAARRGGKAEENRLTIRPPRCTPPLRLLGRSSSAPTPERPPNPTAQARVFPPPPPRGRTYGRTEPPDLFLPILRHTGGGKACELGGARRGEARPPRCQNHVYDPSAVQFSSVTQSCQTLCDPVNSSRPGLRVHHQLPESTQTHVH